MKINRPKSVQPTPANAQKVFAGIIFDVYHWQQKLYDGSQATFEKIKRRDSVNIIPVTQQGQIIVTAQEQPGRDFFYGMPGGMIDDGEDVLTAAKRELLEETGYASDQWVLWEAIQYTSKIDWAVYTFIAKQCYKQKEAKPDAGEKIDLRFLDFDDYVALMVDDKFRDNEIALKILKKKFKGEIEALKNEFI